MPKTDRQRPKSSSHDRGQQMAGPATQVIDVEYVPRMHVEVGQQDIPVRFSYEDSIAALVSHLQEQGHDMNTQRLMFARKEQPTYFQPASSEWKLDEVARTGTLKLEIIPAYIQGPPQRGPAGSEHDDYSNEQPSASTSASTDPMAIPTDEMALKMMQSALSGGGDNIVIGASVNGSELYTGHAAGYNNGGSTRQGPNVVVKPNLTNNAIMRNGHGYQSNEDGRRRR